MTVTLCIFIYLACSFFATGIIFAILSTQYDTSTEEDNKIATLVGIFGPISLTILTFYGIYTLVNLIKSVIRDIPNTIGILQRIRRNKIIERKEREFNELKREIEGFRPLGESK